MSYIPWPNKPHVISGTAGKGGSTVGGSTVGGSTSAVGYPNLSIAVAHALRQ